MKTIATKLPHICTKNQEKKCMNKRKLLQMISGFASKEKQLCYKASKNLHSEEEKTQKISQQIAPGAALPTYRSITACRGSTGGSSGCPCSACLCEHRLMPLTAASPSHGSTAPRLWQHPCPLKHRARTLAAASPCLGSTSPQRRQQRRPASVAVGGYGVLLAAARRRFEDMMWRRSWVLRGGRRSEKIKGGGAHPW